MPRARLNLGGGPGLLDIGTYGRLSQERRGRLSAPQIELIARTVHRTPEVMVKVLSRGGQDVASVARHLSYLNRRGALDLESDHGDTIRGKDAAEALLDEWDLRLDEIRRSPDLSPTGLRLAPKLVHKIMFSMPPGTPAEAVHAAVKNFARDEFALKHRYVLVLHTDEPHPHVHLVVKAMGNDGRRLNIRKATLRDWRREFARHLREQGVAANATERVARGATRPQKIDGIYRAGLRGESTHYRHRLNLLPGGRIRAGGAVEAGERRLARTRQDVLQGWRAVATDLNSQGHPDLARVVLEFVDRMPPPLPDDELMMRNGEPKLAKVRTRAFEERRR